MACLLQANPDMSNMDLMNAVQASGSIAIAPDNKIGWGIPDFMAAHNILTVIDGNEEAQFSNLKLYPNPFINAFEVAFDAEGSTSSILSIVDMTGRTVYEKLYILDIGVNNLQVKGLDNLPSGIYFMRLESAHTSFTMKIVRR